MKSKFSLWCQHQNQQNALACSKLSCHVPVIAYFDYFGDLIPNPRHILPSERDCDMLKQTEQGNHSHLVKLPTIKPPFDVAMQTLSVEPYTTGSINNIVPWITMARNGLGVNNLRGRIFS